MPRGGGGGFRGGGGGFRGGGFRGGGFSGRGSFGGGYSRGYRSSSRPFGRTGATRTVSGSRRGTYSHRYYRPHRRYYRYRPWYSRWWYSPYWSGYWYRPWYYSPAYVGGGIAIAILSALVILPFMGVNFWYPFSDADENGNVNYRSTELLYYNEYWYEYESINAGGNIRFDIQSSSATLSFAISDQPFSSFLTPSKLGNYSENNMALYPYWYEYYQIYLNSGSSISYDFNASGEVDFYVFNGQEFHNWDWGYSYYSFEELQNTLSGSGTVNIMASDDYYLVWYNDGTTSSTHEVNFTIEYTATDVYDLSSAYHYEEVDPYSPLSNTTQVPSSGTWYFYIYFDPMISPEESTWITFDVTYETGITAADRWISASPILILIIVIVAIVIVAAVVARRSQKKLKAKTDEKAKQATVESKQDEIKATKSLVQKKTVKVQVCARCGSENSSTGHYCVYCGGKLVGRAVKTPQISTPPNSKRCASCGSKIIPDDNFCKYCGTPIKH